MYRFMGCVIFGSCRDKAFPMSRHIYLKSHATVPLKIKGKWTCVDVWGVLFPVPEETSCIQGAGIFINNLMPPSL
jgi:hypothetical protein